MTTLGFRTALGILALSSPFAHSACSKATTETWEPSIARRLGTTQPSPCRLDSAEGRRLPTIVCPPSSPGRSSPAASIRGPAIRQLSPPGPETGPGQATAGSPVDLAAEFFDSALRHDDPALLFSALEYALGARARHPALPEAAYNAALALQLLLPQEHSSAPWSEYEGTESSPRWISAGRTRRSELRCGGREDRATLDNHRLREDALWGDLAAWAEEDTELPASAEALDRAVERGRRLRETHGDISVEAIAGDVEATHSGERARFKQGYRLLVRSRRTYSTNPEEALDAALTSSTLLEELSPAAAGWAGLYEALALFHLERLADAAAALDRARAPAGTGQTALLGYLHWVEGLLDMRSSGRDFGLSSVQRALESFERAGERQEVTRVRALLAECLLLNGRELQSWRVAFDALRANCGGPTAESQHFVYSLVAGLARHRRMPGTNALFTRLAAASARDLNNAAYEVDARIWSAAARGASGVTADDLDAIRDRISAIDDFHLARKATADLDFLASQIASASESATALQHLRSALDHYEKHGPALLVVAARLAEAKIHLARGAADEAEQALLGGLDALDQVGSGAESLPPILGGAEPVRELWMLLSSAASKRGDSTAALAYLENARGRYWNASPVEPDELIELVEQLPPGIPVLAVDAKAGHLRSWLIDDGRLTYSSRSLPPERFDFLVSRAFSKASASERAELAAAVLPPELLRQRTRSRLVVIPSESLAGLPFSALVLADGSLLLERFAVTTVSTLSIYADLAGAQAAPHGAFERAPKHLVVGNPEVDSKFSGSWPNLPGAEREAEFVASQLKGQTTLLIGSDADRARVLEAAAGALTIHYAGHAYVDPLRPELSGLLLTPDALTDHDGWVSARELQNLELSGSFLAVLSACASGPSPLYRRDALLGLARSFHLAGVPRVVATSWPVEDEDAADLMICFYRAPDWSADPAERLRQCKLEQALRTPGGALGDWAAFRYFGAF